MTKAFVPHRRVIGKGFAVGGVLVLASVLSFSSPYIFQIDTTLMITYCILPISAVAFSIWIISRKTMEKWGWSLCIAAIACAVFSWILFQIIRGIMGGDAILLLALFILTAYELFAVFVGTLIVWLIKRTCL